MGQTKSVSIGLYLKSIRKEKELTILQASEKSNISTAQISRIETGARSNPSLDTLQKLTNAYEIDLEQVLKVGGYIS